MGISFWDAQGISFWDSNGNLILGLLKESHFGIDTSGNLILGLTLANPINTWGIQLNPQFTLDPQAVNI